VRVEHRGTPPAARAGGTSAVDPAACITSRAADWGRPDGQVAARTSLSAELRVIALVSGDLGGLVLCWALSLRDQWREHVRAGRWYEAFEAFVDFYNGPGSFAGWPTARRDAFFDDQRTRDDLWDVLFDAPITHATELSRTLVRHLP
jgi:hypothetical protein